ncbi:unnamed protein product [Cuscuta campestris]|uniref:Uncharacterized protein n=2 Tax=Cuscuta sect. Cleistogrammica TaxID=1824901 RepID=A0A484NK55_9ASTE|nr:hypothetical protein DM860_004236 [Cuscuta australis]VFR01403.1 unnamed protein product [Cuscuta campestris]
MANPTNNPNPTDGSGKRVRKPYTITKSRESWSDEEHDKFLEALHLFDRDWKKIEDFVGSKTVIQIRSHAQKYFLKVQKNGTTAHVPPPRPKRKASHPYPQKASKNVLVPLQGPVANPPLVIPLAPVYDTSLLVNTSTSGIMSREDEFYSPVDEDTGAKGAEVVSNINVDGVVSSSRVVPKQSELGSRLHGLPDFGEVYKFIGSMFDPDTKCQEQELKEMDPINLETVLLLMRNLSINLSSPNFEPIRKMLSSNDVSIRSLRVSASSVAKNLHDILC